MLESHPLDRCFCTLALRSTYRQLAQQLATDLAQYAPGMTLVVGTDRPEDFADCGNVWAFRLKSQGVLHCFHDKRFVLAQARSRFAIAIQIDADTRLTGRLAPTGPIVPGIAAVHRENLLEHTQRYNPERLPYLRKLADKLALDLAAVTYVGEALFALTADSEQSQAFIQSWDRIARYLELHGIHAGEGSAIGLAAAAVGLEVIPADWLEAINVDRRHLDQSHDQAGANPIAPLRRRCRYHLRLNQSRIRAIGQYQFFYG